MADLDHDAFMAAFERVAKRLVKAPYNYRTAGKNYNSIPFLREQKYGDLPETLEELIEDNLEDVAVANFVTLLVLREMKSKQAIEHQRFELHPGDLKVTGNFAYEHAVLVQGDLVVGGVIEDAYEASPLLVGGNVRAKAMYLGSETYVGGKVAVDEVLHLRFTRGGNTLVVEGGATAKLYVYTKHDSKLTGKLTAKHEVEAYPERDDPAFAKLLAALTPALAVKLDVEEPDLTLLVRAIRNGATIWR